MKTLILISCTSGVYPNSIRELRHSRATRLQTYRTGAVGYRGPRRVRQTAAIELPRKRRHSHRIFNRLSYQPRQCYGQGRSPQAICEIPAYISALLCPQWYPEVSHFCPSTPLLLIGTKTDLRSDPTTKQMLSAQGQAPITPEHGAAVAKDIGAGYKECSAKTGKGVKEVFDAALRESFKGRWGRSMKQRKCVVM